MSTPQRTQSGFSTSSRHSDSQTSKNHEKYNRHPKDGKDKARTRSKQAASPALQLPQTNWNTNGSHEGSLSPVCSFEGTFPRGLPTVESVEHLQELSSAEMSPILHGELQGLRGESLPGQLGQDRTRAKVKRPPGNKMESSHGAPVAESSRQPRESLFQTLQAALVNHGHARCLFCHVLFRTKKFCCAMGRPVSSSGARICLCICVLASVLFFLSLSSDTHTHTNSY